LFRIGPFNPLQLEEIAAMVGFIGGEGAGYVTATTIFADAGITQGSVGL